jgi:membrane-bound serine protease (ClpP class)
MTIKSKLTLFLLLILLFLIISTSLWADVYLINIEGTIDLGLPPYIERILDEAIEAKAEAVILEINTFGGRLDAATQIKDLLLNKDILSIAFINKRAISAGALISLSCNKIAMVPGSSIGAATVVNQTGEKAPEKAISYFRAEMGATAEKNGRNRLIAEGMVDEDVEVPGLSPKGKLITLTADDAIKWKIADVKAEDVSSALDSLGLTQQKIVTIKINWAEKLVRFLTDPMVSSFLISLGLIGLFFEIKSPGWGLPGSLGLILLALFFGSHYIVQLANLVEIMLFIGGIALLLLEIFVIPGFGIAGIGGIISIIVALYLSLLGSLKYITFPDFTGAAAYLTFSLVLTIIGIIVILKIFPKSSLWNKISLLGSQKKEQGYTASRNYESYLGKEGIAATTLRPSGIGIFDGERLDVVSEGEFINKDCPIIIKHVDGYRLIVREVKK